MFTLTLLGVVAAAVTWSAGPRQSNDRAAITAVASAAEAFVQIPSAPPAQGDPADSLYRAATDAINGSSFREAADMFQQLVTSYPESAYVADALYWRAFALYRLGEGNDLEQALQTLSTMRERFPKALLMGDAAALEQRIIGELARRGDRLAAQLLAYRAQQLALATADSQHTGTACDASAPGASGADVKIAALNALVQMDTARGVAVLQEILQRRDDGFVCLRRVAVLLLAQRQAAGVEMSLLDAARGDPDLEVRKQAVLSLSQFTTEQAVSALDSIVRTGTETQLVEPAVIALSQSSDPRAQQALRAYASRSDVPTATRRTVVSWLLQRPSPENAAFLQELYSRLTGDSSDVELRRSIVQAMSQHVDSATGRWLLNIARGGTGDSMELRAQALALAGPAVAVGELVALYAPELEAPLRAQLLESYAGRLQQEDAAQQALALDGLGEVAKRDPDSELRKKAVNYIAQSQHPHAADVLQRIINTP